MSVTLLCSYTNCFFSPQTIIAGKNRYMINGSTVQNKKVNDLFNSVQLNVNNPHFLIMQGRITKVLNMKPPEVSTFRFVNEKHVISFIVCIQRQSRMVMICLRQTLMSQKLSARNCKVLILEI